MKNDRKLGGERLRKQKTCTVALGLEAPCSQDTGAGAAPLKLFVSPHLCQENLELWIHHPPGKNSLSAGGCEREKA